MMMLLDLSKRIAEDFISSWSLQLWTVGVGVLGPGFGDQPELPAEWSFSPSSLVWGRVEGGFL